jgi:hypothetical protein
VIIRIETNTTWSPRWNRRTALQFKCFAFCIANWNSLFLSAGEHETGCRATRRGLSFDGAWHHSYMMQNRHPMVDRIATRLRTHTTETMWALIATLVALIMLVAASVD